MSQQRSPGISGSRERKWKFMSYEEKLKHVNKRSVEFKSIQGLWRGMEDNIRLRRGKDKL